MSTKQAKRIQQEWEAWRAQYLSDHPGDYPLRHTPPTVAIRAYPMGKPSLCRQYPV